MNTRFKHQPTLTRGDKLPPTPCNGNWAPYEVLMTSKSGPDLRWAIREARVLCGACPIAAKCHAENESEEWVRRLRTAAPVREVPTRDCETCGRTFEIGPRQGQKRYCSDACNKVAWRAARAVA